MAVDAWQSVYVAGYSNSEFLPNASPYCKTKPGYVDGFAVKVDLLGNLVYTKCIGGFATDYANAIAVDSDGSAYVAGSTGLLDFPVVNAFQPVKNGGYGTYDAFVCKLSVDGKDFVYSTYLGGSLEDYASGSALSWPWTARTLRTWPALRSRRTSR